MMLAILNIILFIIIPSILFQFITPLLHGANIPLTENLIFAFGGVITGLQVLGALTEGMAVSVPFESGGYLATAAYIYIAVSGGTIALTVSGLSFVLTFQPLVFLLVLPQLYGALRTPISYLLDYHEASRPAPDTV